MVLIRASGVGGEGLPLSVVFSCPTNKKYAYCAITYMSQVLPVF